jgi:uncharacterized protein (TIGR02594 family)
MSATHADLFALAQRFVGEIIERHGAADHPFIVWCHESTSLPAGTPDEVPWCSSFLNRLCWLLRLPRTKSAAARSWLSVGRAIPLGEAHVGDVVVLKRGPGESPGPDVLDAPGHVGLYAGSDGSAILILGGNQGNGVTVARFDSRRVLGVRRLI